MTEIDDDINVTQFMIDAMNADDVRGWLEERLANCLRLAQVKTGDDRVEWLRDAAYFAAAIGMIDWTGMTND